MELGEHGCHQHLLHWGAALSQSPPHSMSHAPLKKLETLGVPEASEAAQRLLGSALGTHG